MRFIQFQLAHTSGLVALLLDKVMCVGTAYSLFRLGRS